MNLSVPPLIIGRDYHGNVLLRCSENNENNRYSYSWYRPHIPVKVGEPILRPENAYENEKKKKLVDYVSGTEVYTKGQSGEIYVKYDKDEELSIKQIYKTNYGNEINDERFAVILDGTRGIGTWGGTSNAFTLSKDLNRGFVEIVSSNRAFLALRNDGSVYVWGDEAYAGVLPAALKLELDDEIVIGIYSTSNSFGVLTDKGVFHAWTGSNYFKSNDDDESNTGHYSIENAVFICTNSNSFSVLTGERNIVCIDSVAGYMQLKKSDSDINSSFTTIYSNKRAFVGLRKDGFVCWGDTEYGGGKTSGILSSTGVPKRIYHNWNTFVGVLEDDTFVVWGNGKIYNDKEKNDKEKITLAYGIRDSIIGAISNGGDIDLINLTEDKSEIDRGFWYVHTHPYFDESVRFSDEIPLPYGNDVKNTIFKILSKLTNHDNRGYVDMINSVSFDENIDVDSFSYEKVFRGSRKKDCTGFDSENRINDAQPYLYREITREMCADLCESINGDNEDSVYYYDQKKRNCVVKPSNKCFVFNEYKDFNLANHLDHPRLIPEDENSTKTQDETRDDLFFFERYAKTEFYETKSTDSDTKTDTDSDDNTTWYIIGTVVAVLMFLYFLYTRRKT